MTERLQQALQHIEEMSPEEQDEIANIIEDSLTPSFDALTYAGAIAGMLPDNAEEELLRLRREAPPSPPLEEHLQGLLRDESA